MVNVSVHSSDAVSQDLLVRYYDIEPLTNVLLTAWQYVLSCVLSVEQPYELPYYPSVAWDKYVAEGGKHIAIDIYVTDPNEAKALNQQSRGKDYATNILSYPSDLPQAVQGLMDELPLGELVVCHEVIDRQAQEQGKTLKDHLTHLLVHGLLHLLGFDHELGQHEQEQMESLEIEILARLGVANPYQ